MFFNLVAVAALGRAGGLWLRRRRPDLPREVAEDRAGSALLLAVTALVVVGGLAHLPAHDAARRAWDAQRRAVRDYVLVHAPRAYRLHLGQLDTQQHADDFFRTCVPGGALPPLCLLVRTDTDPPTVSVDRDRTLNRHL